MEPVLGVVTLVALIAAVATVARAVEACSGTARFVPQDGRGSTVELDLPAASV